MNLSSFRFFTVALMFVLAAVFSGCSGKKTCSADTQCKDGSYCNDGKCTEFKDDDYKIVFESPSDKATITSAQDLDLSVEGIQIDVKVAMEDEQNYINDGMSVILSIKKGENEVLLTGKFLKNKAVFSQITLPEGEVTLSAYLEQNPGVKTTVTVNSVKMDVTMYYLKGGAEGTKTLLESSIITDEDDSDGNLENGIQLNLVAETAGIKEGDIVNLFFPQISEDNKAGEGNVDANGLVVFENITVPVLANVTMTIVSGEYSENVEFEVSSKIFCGFLLNIEDDQMFGKKDDRNDTLSGLQYDLVISEITGCGKGSKVSIFIDSDETGTPWTIFTISSNQVEERITLQKSTSSEDKRSVLVVVEDEPKNMKGKKTAEGIIVDLDDPSVDISFPQVGAELNMSDDIDAGTPGLQINFAGEASDALTGPVSVEIKLGETVITTLEDINGDFESLYTFPQSLPTAVLTVTVFDEAGNSSDAVVPFTVNIDPEIEFYSVCGHTGADIIDSMWLNISDDADEETDLLQCKVIVRVSESTGATHLSLKAGYDEEVKKELETDNTAEFDISLADSVGGIKLNAKSYIEESVTGENNLTVRVDTEPPVVTMNNSLLLGNGGTTGSENITFEYNCASDYMCTFNALLDDETSTAFVTDTERVLSGLSTGPHSFKVKARDAAGNEGAQTVFNWTVDSVKPETTITSDPGEGTTSNFALFTFTSSITPATFHCRLQKDGINFMPADGTWEECNSGSRNYYGLAEGTYRFQVYAEDGAGNTDPSPAEHEWIIGSVAPVTTITKITPSTSPVSLDTIEFEFEATVESTYECRLEKGGVIVENWSDCSTKTKSYATLADGNYIFKVRATALYGVVENTPATYNWAVDTTSPKIRFTSKPAVESPYDSGIFSFECVDASTPCVYECELDSAVVDCSAGSYSYASLAGGSHNFKITATDAAGNASTAVTDTGDEFVNDYTWTIDDTVLGVQITAKPDPATTSDSATFEFSSNKAASFECKLDEGSFEVCTSPKDYTTLSEGTHTFTVKAVFGADEAFESYSWIIDNTNPVVTIDLGPDNPTFQTNALFNFSADETASFECKFSTESEWGSCTSPKLYPAGTFGVFGTEHAYTFEVRATDMAGNQGTASHTWVVDLDGPAIEWISPAPGIDGKVIVGKAQDVYSSDPSIYAINVVLKVSGSNPGQPINIAGFKTPPGYNIVNVDTTSPKNYTLTIGLQDGARINNPLTITVEDNTGSVATLNKLVIVNTEMPTITWAYPVNNHKFVANTTDPQFIFNVWNATAGMDVELVDSNTDEVIATRQTVGSSGTYQEYVTFNPAITDKCGSYSFYARLYDPLDEITHYTNAVTDDLLKSSRAVTVDRNKAVVGDITIPGLSDTDRILNRDDNMNPDIDGGMQIDVTVNITDTENSSDNNRTVKLFTNNGIGSDASILLATLYNQGDTAVFEKISLNDCFHTLRVEVSDCSWNVTSKLVQIFTVDTTLPEFTVSAPKGSSSNWRWIVAADDPSLGTIDGNGDFTNVQMVINSSEELGTFIEVIHTAYDYSGTQLYQNNITSSAVVKTDSVEIALPELEYAKHRFAVTVEDINGNISTIGNGSHELFEVDAIVPQITILNLTDGETISDDEDLLIPGFQMNLQVNFADAAPMSNYSISAQPVLSQGGAVDDTRFEKTWTGSVTTDGDMLNGLTLGGGWWRISATVTDDHFNTSVSGIYDVEITNDVPSIAVKKSYGYSIGAGPVINGYSELSPAWMLSEDLNCTGNDCLTEIEVWTDAPAGSTVYISVNGGAETSKVTAASSGMSYADFGIILDSSVLHNTLNVRVVSTGTNEETYYIDIDEEIPDLALINPVDCSTDDVCRRLDVIDNPATTDYIELAELGYGYNDDAVTGGALNFKSSGVIIFEVTGATAGMVKVESVAGGEIAGITNGEAPILYDGIEGIYYADFSNMTVVDDNANGQTDYDVVFKVTESPSGAVSKYLVKLHVDLKKPAAINIDGTLSVNKKTAEVAVDWAAVEGNDSALGGVSGAVHEYDIRYQDYNEGACTIATAFDGAKQPLETIAGTVPDPIITGDMTYNFFINRINNGQTGINFKEADIHRNGNKYCFAVAAVDAVYASDGTVLARNIGTISPNDIGEVKMAWTEIVPVSLGLHAFRLTNLGDIDGDGIDDYVISDYLKTINTENEDRNGKIKIHYSKEETSFELIGEIDDRIGIGISSKADFNGDGFLDFAYTNRYGNISVHFGGISGLSNMPSLTFTAKDASTQNFRSMATGDYNGDGCDDILITAPNSNGSGIQRGEIYIYFGRGAECSSLNPIDGNEPDVIFEGGTDNDKMGISDISAIGDVNNDGKKDFFVGNFSNGHIIYGGTTDETISTYNLTGLEANSYPGRRVGYGDVNGDSIDDLVIGNRSNIRIYYGEVTGISNTPSIIIDDISPINYAYPPTVSSFAMSIPPVLTDLNGDGFSNIVTYSQKGLIVYYSFDDQLMNMPSFYDPLFDSTATNAKLLNTKSGIVYCNNANNFGDCHFINYGE